jgi:hypothetical protein
VQTLDDFLHNPFLKPKVKIVKNDGK